MDPLGDPLTTCPIQTGWEFIMEPYPSGQFGLIYDPDRQFRNGSVWTWILTRSDSPELLLTLIPRCGWDSGVWGYWLGPYFGGRGAGARGCGHGVCSRMSWHWSGRAISSLSTVVSTLSADEFAISYRPIVPDTMPLSSLSSSLP